MNGFTTKSPTMSNTSANIQLRTYFQSLNSVEKNIYIKSLTSQEQLYFYQHPDLFCFDKQIIPDGNWIYYLLRCGRSFGKTYAGSAWVAKKIRNGAKIIGLCGPTYDDVAKVMIPAIISWFMPHELADPPYNNQTHTLRFANGAKIYCYTSDKEIRGPNLEYLWLDEICVWSDGIPEKIKERFEDIVRTVRVGKHPQTIITSTPKPHPFFIDFQEEIDRGNPAYQMLVGTMFDNPTLPQSYIDEQLAKYGTTNRGKQELYGELITENPEALFNKLWINAARIVDPELPIKYDATTQPQHLAYFFNQVLENKIIIKRIGISADPAVSNGKASDETGIIVGAQAFNGDIYILSDYSGKHTPDAWAKIVRNQFNHYRKHFTEVSIIAEVNQGGDLVVSNLCAVDHTLKPHIKCIHASKGKLIRAEPVAAKYQRKKVHHVGFFPLLERQMTNYTGDSKMGSPDHLDALVHLVNEFTIVPQYTKRNLAALAGF